ncbi:hypothetical protein GCM10027346_38620 [Hymenobacter seoulensis]
MKTFTKPSIPRQWLPAFGFGAAAGLVATMLWAPASGHTTRRSVRQWLRTGPQPKKLRATPPATTPNPGTFHDLSNQPDHLLANL